MKILDLGETVTEMAACVSCTVANNSPSLPPDDISSRLWL